MSTVVVYMFLSLYVNVGIMYLLNFFGEWYLFIAVKLYFVVAIALLRLIKNGQ